jgi:hypothetical protein
MGNPTLANDLPAGLTLVDDAPASTPAPQPAPQSELPTGLTLVNQPTGAASMPGANMTPADFSAPGANTFARSAPLWTAAEASLQPSTDGQIDVYSKRLGLPKESFGVDRDGNVGYADKDGWHLVNPTIDAGSFGKPLDALHRITQQAASVIGPAIPAVSSLLGGFAAAPSGPVGAVAGAGAGGFAGDLFRQSIGNLISGRNPTDVSLLNAAGQGLMGATGEGVGLGAVKLGNGLFGSNAVKMSAPDFERFARGPRIDDARALMDEAAQRFNIPMTPAEATGAKSLLARQRQMGRFPESSDTLGDFTRTRNNEQVPNAITAQLGEISDQGAPALGARDLQQGAKDVMQRLTDARSAAASPHYETAFNSGAQPDTSGVLSTVNRLIEDTAPNSDSRRTMQTVRGLLGNERPVIDPATGQQAINPLTRQPMTRFEPADYRQLQSSKETIDAVLDNLEGSNLSVDTKMKSRLTQVQQELTNSLRQAHSSYEQGYQAYIANSPAIDQARQGLVGMMARDRQFVGNMPSLFASGDPVSIRQARSLFEQNGQLDQWNAGLRANLQGALESATRVAQGGERTNVAGKFYQATLGDPAMAANLRAAMTPDQYTGMETLTKVLQAVARSPAEGSPTATDIGARGAFASNGASGAAAILRGTRVWDILPAMGDAIENLSAGKNIDKLAKLYTDPEAMSALAKVRMLSPLSVKSVEAASSALTRAGILSTGIAKPEPRAPLIRADATR